MGTGPFAAAKLPTRPNAQMPNEGEALPLDRTNAKMPSQRICAAERLRRLEEAKTFLRQHLAAGPQPARTLLKAARAARKKLLHSLPDTGAH